MGEERHSVSGRRDRNHIPGADALSCIPEIGRIRRICMSRCQQILYVFCVSFVCVVVLVLFLLKFPRSPLPSLASTISFLLCLIGFEQEPSRERATTLSLLIALSSQPLKPLSFQATKSCASHLVKSVDPLPTHPKHTLHSLHSSIKNNTH